MKLDGNARDADCAKGSDSLGQSATGSVTDAFCLWLSVQCNNPKTKEPKLTAAARIVPEWVEYDNEIKELLRHIQDGAQKQTPPPSRHKKG